MPFCPSIGRASVHPGGDLEGGQNRAAPAPSRPCHENPRIGLPIMTAVIGGGVGIAAGGWVIGLIAAGASGLMGAACACCCIPR